MNMKNISFKTIDEILALHGDKIEEILNELGNVSDLIGYDYWAICTALCIKDKSYFGNLMELYNAISILNGVKYNTVIGNMSRVKKKWLEKETTFEIFKKDIDEKGELSNKKILMYIVEKVGE